MELVGKVLILGVDCHYLDSTVKDSVPTFCDPLINPIFLARNYEEVIGSQ